MLYYVIFENAAGRRIKREVSEIVYKNVATIQRFDDSTARSRAWGIDAPVEDYRVVCAAGGTTTAAGDKGLGR